MSFSNSTRSEQTHSRAVAARWLSINYIPGIWATFEGTRAQLLAAGLVPGDLDWPQGDAQARWVCDQLDFMLFGCRPLGPNEHCIAGDWWWLRVRHVEWARTAELDVLVAMTSWHTHGPR